MKTALMRSGFLSMVAKTLLVSDRSSFQYEVRNALRGQGFDICSVTSLDEADEELRQRLIELVVIHHDSDPEGALALCRRIRRDPLVCGITVVMAGDAVDERDLVKALWVGADEFIEMPVEDPVLVARLKSLMRRQAAGVCETDSGRHRDSSIRVGELVLDPKSYRSWFAGCALDLTVVEFRIIRLLAGRPGDVVPRDRIVEALHGELATVDQRSIDSRIYSLRKKLGENADYIETVRGAGYRLNVGGSSSTL